MVIAANKNPGPASLPRLARRVVPQRTADIMIDVLANAGIDTVFGIPGGAIAALNDALLDRTDIRCVTTRHEGGAMFAALGYAAATGKPAVVLVTSGPGALNCLPGIASAFCDSLPVIVLAGEVPRALFGKGALQEGSANHLNIVGMSKPVTKLSLELTDPCAAPAMLRRAITTAITGRPGPVLLSMPLDVTTAVINRPGLAANVRVSSHLEKHVVQKVAGTLQTAERAVIYAGSGARWGRGPERLRELAEKLQIPVMTTPKAKGVFPESHPLSLGIFGHGGHPSTTTYLEEGVGVLLAVGCGFSDPATNGWSPLLIPRDHLIQIDTDALRIGRNYPVSLGLVGPAEEVLEQICDELPAGDRAPKTYGVRYFSEAQVEAVGSSGKIAPQRALWELEQVMPAGTLYGSDIGEHMLFATHYLKVDDPRGFLIMTGLASMGSGLAGALGMKLGRPDRSVVSVVGDGCFAMSLGDLATAVRERIPLVVAVLNDQRYGMVELGHLSIYGRTPPYPVTEVDIAGVARSLGADAAIIESPGQILNGEIAERSMLAPIVLDIRIDRSVRMRMERTEQLTKSTLSRGSRGDQPR